MSYKVGIDVGGTFTDFLLTHEDGSSEIYKVLSTPEDPSVGLMNGLREMAESKGVTLEEFIKEVDTIVHGTTVTTNAVLTYRGAKTGLLTTKGVRDALEMRRGIREEQYNNHYENVKPLVPRYLRMPVQERLDYRGDELLPLEESHVEAALDRFEKEGVEAVAICFMNSFANPEHERKAAEMVARRMPHAYLTVSSTLLPSIRFYDRVSTTVLNAYVGPILRRYLTSLIEKLEDVAFQGILLIMQSNGGVVSPENAMETAAVTLLSGPAGGPVAGISYTSVQGYKDCITVDMGGTSFDAALIKDRTPVVTTEGEINRLRLALPMLNIVTIGAGGGSIGWIDEGGLLRMGPHSAGAKPGPACYDLGGELPTCTDADLVLGYLDPDYFAGGRIRLNRKKAERAIEEHVARKLKMDVLEAAAGMYDVINVNMASGVREVSVKRGHDPRDFPMVIAGGAGPNHACMIARELEIPVMIIPKESSIFCAAGMLMSDLRHNFVRTYVTTLEGMDVEKFVALFLEMEREGGGLMESEHIPPDRVEYVYSLDMRYIKQYHEVNVAVTREEILNRDIPSMAARFHPEHDRLFGYSLEEEGTPIELINMRLACIGRTEKPRLVEEEYRGPDPSGALKGRRSVYLPLRKEFQEIDVFDGHRLHFGNRVEGPALIEQVNTTTFVTPEYSVICDRFGSYTMYLKQREAEYVGRVVR
ncbi:MAG: hydantoinase/oxoprolinase family protein [Deltaproteobacteria bacterium]|nr:hydantoinase/oxoprolinase family protein [Deltaproteobacteria bacterium]